MTFSKFRKINFHKSLVIILILALAFPGFFVISQDDCKTKDECEKLLKELEEKIRQYEIDITKNEAKIQTLEYQISSLKNKINQLDLEIRKGNIVIKDITLQIQDTETSIEKTSLKIEDLKEKLIGILRTIYEEDQKSLVEILVSEDTLSGFFNNLMSLEVLNQTSQEILENIKDLKASLESQKEKLGEEKDNLARAVKVQTLEKQQSEEAKKEQEKIKKMTEAQYQQYLKEKKELEKRAAEIMSRITQLTLPGLAVPQNKEELYKLAKWAGDAAGGVRPALILGLLEVESALGINVGQCNCAGQPVCRHPQLTYKQVMSEKQWSAFETICKELGLKVNTTPVSCYVDGGKVQMGGAMGPAQFMPTTWLNGGYKQRVEAITGIKPANPWRASDAFLAAALYLADWGAATKNLQSETGAVTAYLCGTSSMTPRCQQAGGAWYVSTVMGKADFWQQQINQGI